MAKEKINAKIVRQEQIGSDIYSMVLKVGELAKDVVAGQFISMYCHEGSRLLPRPISICEVNKEEQTLRVVYRVVGNGTKELSTLTAGESIEILAPLGNGFTVKEKKAILIGGGIGIPPMLELAKSMKTRPTVVLGYRNELFLNQEFEPYADVVIATEDGSTGTKGTVLDAIKENQLTGEIIYACGPTPMLKAISEYAIEKGIEAQVSLEERMACGIGACLACVCKSKEKDHHTNVNNKRICKDGPVFEAREIDW